MNIKQVKEEIVKLEGSLAVEIANQINAFREKTGVSIESVYVNMLDVQSFGDKQAEYIVGNVSCKIAF